jgi:hypothetical protein
VNVIRQSLRLQGRGRPDDHNDAIAELFGVPGGGDVFFERAILLVGQLGEMHYIVMLLSLVAIAMLVLGAHLFPGKLSLSVLSFLSRLSRTERKMPPEQLGIMQKNLCQLPEPPAYPVLTKKDGLGAIAVCLLVFLSTSPVILPFLFICDARFALRLSNAIAIAMMFICGYFFGHYAGLPRWVTGALSIAVGCALVFTANRLRWIKTGATATETKRRGGLSCVWVLKI